VKGMVFEGEPIKMEVSKSKPGPKYNPDFKGRKKGKKKFKGKKRRF
jgi:hypothetical protein